MNLQNDGTQLFLLVRRSKCGLYIWTFNVIDKVKPSVNIKIVSESSPGGSGATDGVSIQTHSFA